MVGGEKKKKRNWGKTPHVMKKKKVEKGTEKRKNVFCSLPKSDKRDVKP